MGSYKWIYKEVAIVISHTRGPISPLITPQEPPSIDDVGPQRSTPPRRKALCQARALP